MNLAEKRGCYAECEGNGRRFAAYLEDMLEKRFFTGMGGIVFVRQVSMAIGARRGWLALHRVALRLVNMQR